MSVRTDDLVKILQLKGMGRKTARKFCELDFNGSGNDIIDFLIEVGSNNIISRFPVYHKQEILAAFEKGQDILEKSARADVCITSIYDKRFPANLKSIIDPPLVINTKGNLDDLS